MECALHLTLGPRQSGFRSGDVSKSIESSEQFLSAQSQSRNGFVEKTDGKTVQMAGASTRFLDGIGVEQNRTVKWN